MQLNLMTIASQIVCNEPKLAAFRAQAGGTRPTIRMTALVVGTVLARPLSPAHIEENPHPLRYGYSFESRDLNPAEVESIRRQSPSSLHKAKLAAPEGEQEAAA